MPQNVREVEESVRGHLLIAAPSLFDYFRRTVVLVLEHTPDGAMGVVLGRSSETRVADAVPALAELPGADDLVYLGGPVSPQSVVALGEFERPEEAGTQVVGSLGTLDPDGRTTRCCGFASTRATRAGGRASSTASSRRAPGSSTRPTRRTRSAQGDIWSEALERKGGRYRLMATMPTDPSLN